MPLDRWLAAGVLAVCVVYGYAAYTYTLLPFERHIAFRPNTMPMALSFVGAALSLLVLLAPRKPSASPDIDLDRLADYRLATAAAVIASMVAYALLLRPAGFLIATTAFLAGNAWLLGERRYWLLATIPAAGALAVWLLVQEALGIFMRPWPGFLGG